MEWTQAAIEERVERLAAEHEGAELVAAVTAFGEQLDDEGRRVLGRVLVRRAGGRELQAALMEETRRPRWFRRVLAAYEERGRRP